jgi:hypothetical protein
MEGLAIETPAVAGNAAPGLPNRPAGPQTLPMTGSNFSSTRIIPPPAEGWRVGANVPWSVSWTGEQEFSLEVSEDFPGLMDLVQVERPGDGAPRFAAIHVSRHRAGMVRQICHVCGKRTPRGDRWIFPVQSGGFVTLPDESRRYAGNVPPVHANCAKRARLLCPHLRHALAGPVAVPAEETQLRPRTDVVAGMAELAKTLPGNLPIVFSCYRMYGPRFTRKVLQARGEVGGGVDVA